MTQLPSTTTACCNGQHQQISPLANSNYFCPMCPGQESAIAGECHHCGMALERNPSFSHPTFYTCPMHPQVRQETPGDCPLCGMPLEQITESNEDLATAKLTDITRRFWIGTALTLPVLLLAMAHMIPSLSHDPRVIGNSSRWTQFILSSPVVFWVAWPFFKQAWQSLVSRHLNMFTLIAIGVGTAYIFSATVILAPHRFPTSPINHGQPAIYFEAAAAIVVLALLGQMLELRARGKTGDAIRALLDLTPKTVRLVENGEESDVPLSRIQTGAHFAYAPVKKFRLTAKSSPARARSMNPCSLASRCPSSKPRATRSPAARLTPLAVSS